MKRQEEIKNLLTSLGLSRAWLADKLGLRTRTLEYLLNESPNLEDDLYNQIQEIIDSYQYELEFNKDSDSEALDLFEDEKLTTGIGIRIRIFAKRKYGTLKELANALEISPQQLHQYVSGSREPGAKILAKFLRIGCDINWLLGGMETEHSSNFKLEAEVKRLKDAVAQISEVVKKVE